MANSFIVKFIKVCNSYTESKVSYIVELDPIINLGYIVSIVALVLGIALSAYLNSKRRG